MKAQSDLGKTLLDPFFAEDDYNHACLALSEYTYRLNKLAHGLLDFCNDNNVLSEDDKARLDKWLNDSDDDTDMDVKPARITRAIMEVHSILNTCVCDIEKRKKQEETNSPSNKKIADDQVGTATHGGQPNDLCSMSKENKHDTAYTGITCIEIDPEQFVAQADGHLDQIGPVIMTLVEGIIEKHNLSENTMYNVQQRLKAKNRGVESRGSGSTRNNETESDKTENTEETNANKSDGDIDAGVDENVTDPDGDDGNNEVRDTEDTGEPHVNLGIKSEDMKKEVFDVLKKKFILRFGMEDRKSDLTNLYNKVVEEDKAKEVEKSTGKESGGYDNVTEGALRETIPLENYNPAEHIKMNIYSLSIEFIKELHDIKQRTFAERKDRAMIELHMRCFRVKREMKMVEKAVVEELNRAYIRKKKKVENQAKQMDKKQEQLEEAQRLLAFYARTGQHDKLAELMRQINLHHEKN